MNVTPSQTGADQQVEASTANRLRSSLPAGLKEKLSAEVERTPSLRRRTVTNALIAASAAAAAILIAGFVGMGAIHWDGRPTDYIRIAALSWGAIAVFATWAAFPINSLMGRPRIVVLALAVAAPLAAMGAMLGLNFVYPATFAQCGTRVGYVCLDLTLTMGAVPVLALLGARRVGWSARPRLSGASIGIATGAWTGVAITLSCECTNPRHVFIGHVLPMVILALFGTLIAERMAQGSASSQRRN